MSVSDRHCRMHKHCMSVFDIHSKMNKHCVCVFHKLRRDTQGQEVKSFLFGHFGQIAFVKPYEHPVEKKSLYVKERKP